MAKIHEQRNADYQASQIGKGPMALPVYKTTATRSTTIAYRTYLIRENIFTGQFWIEKDSVLIAHAASLVDAKNTVDMLVVR